MQLDQKTINTILELMQPLMKIADERRMRVEIIFMGSGKKPPAIDYEGTTQAACFRILKTLIDYGEIETGKQALWVLLESLIDEYGVTKQNQIRALEPLLNTPNTTIVQPSPSYTAKTSQSGQSWWRGLTEGQGMIIAALIAGLFTVFAAWMALGRDKIPENSTPEPTTVAQIVTDEGIEAELPIVSTEPTATLVPDNKSEVLTLARQGVSSNAEWHPYVQEINGVQMALVPVGCFMMGSENGDGDEQPVHETCFYEPFLIDVYEVSNAQFVRFRGEANRNSNWTEGNLPRESINWYEALNFCVLRGGYLPTEAQWEYAARGPDSLEYPWGNSYNDALLNDGNENEEDNFQNTAPINTFENGKSWIGAYQMSGNVSEWVNTIYDNFGRTNEFPYPYATDDGRENIERNDVRRVVRGGSWFDTDLRLTRATYRNTVSPASRDTINGFRCARDFEG